MIRALALLLLPLFAIAQTPPKLSTVEINGTRYIEIAADQENKVLVKTRTPTSGNEEEKPTVKNEYERLPVFVFKTALGYQSFSSKEMSGPGPQGKMFAPNESNMGAAFDYGVAFRIPSSGPARRLSTGFLFNISQSDTPTVLEENESYIRNRQQGLAGALFSQWTVFSEYDVLIFRGRNTKAISFGAYYDNHVFQSSTCCWDKDEAFQNVHDVGGVARLRLIRSDGSAAFSRWEISVYAGQGKTVRVTIGVDHIFSKKRINPPVQVVK
jgi:hypothetical protein